ncbi:MAG: PIG-L family deacetylase [Bacteroidetes bacterium]|jgi:LmbE family N-acetylglucosaminyl deacetylase|nr:MAG: PIG-L family deacetylase [Bacteroidota bacterium]
MKHSSRRQFLNNSVGSLGLLAMPSVLYGSGNRPFKSLKIVCVGGHPDDPESICGGTLAKFAAAGHRVTIIYLTKGEAGIESKSHEEAAYIRSDEAIAACKILNAKAVFAGQVDGDTVVNNEWVVKMQQLLATEKPDIVFTHWPIDTHKDHQAASLLTIQAWVRSKEKFDLYFCEACPGAQTLGFHPNSYIDITETQEQKRKAVFCHTSQDPAGIYDCGHTSSEDFRGRELGVKAAEAFVYMTGKRKGNAGPVI